MEESKKTNIFTIYGGRISKSGKRLNISIVKGDKEFSLITLPLERVSIKDGYAIVKIKMLEKDYDHKEKQVEEDIPIVKDEDIPF